jgi:two-component system OmpR family sensor kinase
MTLASRLSASFLGALALVLAGFSATLYGLAVVHLHRSVDDRIGATLTTLAALVEDEAGGLEWEPHDRRMIPGQDRGRDEVRWTVRDGQGTLLDRSANLGEVDPLGEPARRRADGPGHPWRVVARRLEPSSLGPAPPGPPRHRALTLTAALRLDPVEATLRNLGLTLIGLALGLWGLTATVGRRLCRRALAPLTRMAGAARDLGADNPARRLPVAPTGDELEDLAHAFNGLLGRHHEALERQRRFAGDASHQLRTPLTAVIGQVDVALRRDRPAEEYRRVLGLVRDQSDHLRRIVEALLFLARADAEAGEPTLDEFDLIPWVGRQIARRAALGGPDTPAWAEPLDGPYRVRAHPALLGQVLDNLLDNARDHGRPGQPAEVRAWREPGLVALAVEDRGRGIDPADLARIFEPFYRARGPRRDGHAGVGLGLAVARRIAHASRGTLAAQSEPGRGSRFVLRLPEVEVDGLEWSAG